MTADGEHIVGPAPGADGFFIVGCCSVAGLSVFAAIGEVLAAWIVDREPLSVTRFGAQSEDNLRRDAARQYHHFYGTAR